ncbi:MAG: hypothetical protein ACTHK0_14785 [Ginsengibacter sp.]
MFLLILFVLDFVFGSILATLYSKQKPGDIYRVSYSMDSTKQDILVFGASRANHHYVPEIFQKRMNLSCYNTGSDGQIILYNYAILKSFLQRYSPKRAILDFSRDEFDVEQKSYDRLSALIPYYKTHPEIQKIINLRSPYEKYKMISRIYPYNSLIFSIIMGSMKSHEERKRTNEQNGYIPFFTICNKPLGTDTGYGIKNLDINKISAFESFVKDCKKSNVKLYVIISPLFIKYLHENPSVNIVKSFAQKYQFAVFNFTNDSLFYNNNLFSGDGTHLNDKGARFFTNLVIDSIIKDQRVNVSKEILGSKQHISNN